jgi:hypothetical protein
MKYRKKPVVIDAVQWTENNPREVFNFLTENTFDMDAMRIFQYPFYIDDSKVEGGLVIKTLEGEHIVSIGDYIIRGIKGEYYPCKEDIFHQTYELYESIGLNNTGDIWRGNGPFTIPCNEKVPFHTLCGCTTCNCTMGNNLVYPANSSSTTESK